MALRRRRSAAQEQQDATLNDWAEDLSDSFILCRDIGHLWRGYRAQRNELGTYDRTLKCSRCKTERHQTVGLMGGVSESRYTYPDGYLAPKGIGPYNADARAKLRLTSVLRLINGNGSK